MILFEVRIFEIKKRRCFWPGSSCVTLDGWVVVELTFINYYLRTPDTIRRICSARLTPQESTNIAGLLVPESSTTLRVFVILIELVYQTSRPTKRQGTLVYGTHLLPSRELSSRPPNPWTSSWRPSSWNLLTPNFIHKHHHFLRGQHYFDHG